MKKKVLASIFAMLIIFGVCAGAAFAMTEASTTLASYSVSASAGNSSGQVKFNYNVRAKRPADSVGVSSITIYTSTGNYVTTITGTTSNGLIATNSTANIGTYTYTGAVSGTSYYALITVFAEIGNDYDDATIPTGYATAP